MNSNAHKTITFVVPCYNSAEYMDHCVSSLLTGSEDVEVIIVDDGSVDDTGAKADQWAAQHPGLVRVIHQENKGHGGAVMAGLREARGVYFKVVDSDDWLENNALGLTLSKLRHFVASGSPVDLVVANYVYEHMYSGTRKVIRYGTALPKNRVFTWNETGPFTWSQYIVMHAAIYRTQLLRNSGLELPEHTYYVDNIFVYTPLPHVETLYYLPTNLYRYCIGREDQSVNEKVQVSRLDQQMRVTEILVDAVKIPEGVGNRKLAAYMCNFLSLIVAASSAFALIDGSRQALEQRRQMWRHIDQTDPHLKVRLGFGNILVLATNLPGAVGRRVSLGLYRLAQRLYRFN
ncbi:MAG: glycosyltransferase family 2 protein [Propionibacteriaceae bacterium]|nr:glycosyltransferase family 2 protein [Propionibacteriaceae bacterium]